MLFQSADSIDAFNSSKGIKDSDQVGKLGLHLAAETGGLLMNLEQVVDLVNFFKFGKHTTKALISWEEVVFRVRTISMLVIMLIFLLWLWV